MKRRAGRPTVITSAERSQEDQLRTRQVRYVLMMSIRIVCLLVAAILVSTRPPLLWLWLSFCAFGMIVIPWLAVVLANDRLPKERHRWRHHRPEPTLPPSLPTEIPLGRAIESDRRSGDT